MLSAIYSIEIERDKKKEKWKFLIAYTRTEIDDIWMIVTRLQRCIDSTELLDMLDDVVYDVSSRLTDYYVINAARRIPDKKDRNDE